MLLTVLGEFVLPADGAAWTGTLVEALVAVGYRDRNARQVLARLGDDGRIRSERVGRRTRWHLTEEGGELLSAGAERIYRFGGRAETWDGRWLLVQCAVPEVMRTERRLLQTRLSFEGFGFLSPTLAVSPHPDREAVAGRVLTELGLDDLAVVMVGETGSLSPDDVILDRAWDLAGLRRDYAAFVDRFERSAPGTPEDRFAELVQLVHEWRRFPFRDPEIPIQLLPADWAGRQALALFEDRRAAWGPDAAAHFAALEAASGG